MAGPHKKMIAGKPKIDNVAMPTAATEYSYAVPVETNKILLKLRSTTSSFQLSYVAGETGTNYVTIGAGSAKTIDELKGGMTIYFQSPDPDQVMEIETWK